MMHPSLEATLAEAVRLLAEGVADATSPFRTPTLATTDALGAPQQRTVVLRAFDAAARQLDVHTDARSAKHGELLAAPAASLHVWDAERRLQVRVAGRAALHSGDRVAQAAWETLSPLGRQLYRVRQSPGTTVGSPEPGQFDEYPEAAGFANFVVVRLLFVRIETLRLAGHGQIRARFDWREDAMSAHWLVP